jgi:hypothetical protein
MKKICIRGLLLGTNHGCISANPNQSVLQCNGNIPVHVQRESLRLRIRHQLRRLCLPCFWIFKEYFSPFSEAWWKCELYIVRMLLTSTQASGCYSQKTFRPSGKRRTASSWQCHTPYSTSNPGENSRTTVGTSWTYTLEHGIGPQWLPSV